MVIGSDTIVVVDGDVLGKPRGRARRGAMLRLLSGRSHLVITGRRRRWRGRVESDVEEVGVTFRRCSDADIAGYVATGEPMDKAGAYGIQGYRRHDRRAGRRRLLRRHGAAAPSPGAVDRTVRAALRTSVRSKLARP